MTPTSNLSQTVLSLQEAISCLQNGGIIGIPTETVYGLAADARNEAAIRRVFEAKGRPGDHPVIVHIASVEQLAHWAIDIPENAYTLATAFWPGPMTLVLKKAPHVSPIITGGQETIAVRIPAHPLALALLQTLGAGAGLIAPSANRFGHVSPTTAVHVLADLGNTIDGVLDGGPCTIGIESTIISLLNEMPEILRPGQISNDAIANCLGIAAADFIKKSNTSTNTPRVSGSLKSHYAPKIPCYLATKQQCSELNSNDVLLHFETSDPSTTHTCYKLPATPDPAAAKLYATLRQIDTDLSHNPPARLFILLPPNTPEWAGVRDRLTRAATGKCLLSAKQTLIQ